MVGDGVINTASDAVLVLERLREAIAVFDHPNRVLVVDMFVPVSHLRYDDADQVGVKEGCIFLTDPGPALYLGQLYPTDGRMDVGHSVIEADQFVFILAFHALVTEQPQTTLNFCRPC